LYGATCSGGITKKKKWTIVYPNIPSALRPVPRAKEFPFPNLRAPKEFTIGSDDEDEGESTSGSPDPPASTEPNVSHGRSSAPQPNILTQDELKDLVRDLELSKSKAKLLGSRLKRWNLLEKNVRMSSFRSHQQLEPFFRKEDVLVFCYDVDGLMNALGMKHDPQEWRLFLDSSKLSLNSVLLHNGNQHPSIPVGHAVHMKET
jgi:hypothetical protein